MSAPTGFLAPSSVARVGGIAVTALVAAAVLALAISASGHPVGPAFAALARGAFGSWDAVLSGTLVRATPLVLAGLAVTVAFRAGVLNIGAEGQLLAGAAAATAVGLALGNGDGGGLVGSLARGGTASLQASPFGVLAAPAALVAGGLGGAAVAGVAAWLRARHGVLEVISTLLLNAMTLACTGWLVRGPLQEPTGIYPQSPMLGPSARLPVLWPGTRLHAGWLLALVLAAGLAWWLQRTAGGFRLRATGANPSAAASAGGIATTRLAAWAFVASGALAGLAGAVEVTGVTYALYENLSPGYGFTAIAVALLAGLDPRWVPVTGVVFGALEAGAGAMQRDAGVPSVLVSVVEAVVILALVLARQGRRPRWLRARTMVAAEAGP